MTRRFTCRGFEGGIYKSWTGGWFATVQLTPEVLVEGVGPTERAAKSRVRRKLDAVEKAFRQRSKR